MTPTRFNKRRPTQRAKSAGSDPAFLTDFNKRRPPGQKCRIGSVVSVRWVGRQGCLRSLFSVTQFEIRIFFFQLFPVRRANFKVRIQLPNIFFLQI
jgi:hypothetical protein